MQDRNAISHDSDPCRITAQLLDWSAGSDQALAVVFSAMYDGLRRVAERALAGERADHTLGSAGLVSEAFFRMMDQQRTVWRSRDHFVAVAAQMMRRILIDHARSRITAKRGGGVLTLPFIDAALPTKALEELVGIHDAVVALAAVERSLGEVVELRFFGGMTNDEIAGHLGVSVPTVERRWRMARAWLFRYLDDARGSEIERLFGLAIQVPHEERARFLDAACEDPDVRREVESLLRADQQAGKFLEPQPPPLCVDDRIGCYRLLRKIGEGETSIVYLATRDDDHYRQQVAIKLIRPGIDSQQIVQRFQQERQILASLTHPNIARLLDGGCRAGGQPYFVMEYVDGQPLDVHCRRARLSVAQRLELFASVCAVVHFAHSNLVVHRDLKPGNILVDADGAPKLVDFGIAKVLDPARFHFRVDAATLGRLMTPYYASPEQVRGKQIGTATDVYSLGVILYELLTERRPYELTSHSLREVEQVVCESTPASPSQVVRAAQRERLPRDIDNVVRMAMRKEPERRYASAQELADDVRRCLERRPVRARRDTLSYRLSSFVRRNTGPVAAAAAIIVFLISSVIVTTWQWRRALTEQRRAESQRQHAEHTLAFVVDLFKVPDSPVPVAEVKAGVLLQRGVARLQAEQDQPPETRAALQHTLGVVYRNLGDLRQAASLLEAAAAARARAPDSQLELADTLCELGAIDGANGHPDRAVALLRGALEIRTHRMAPDDPAIADVLEELAANSGYKIPVPEAEEDLRRALAIRQRDHTRGPLAVVSTMATLAELYSISGQHEDAAALSREAIALYERSAGDKQCSKPEAEFFGRMGVLRYRQGFFDDAAHQLGHAVDCLRRLLGPDHIEVVDAMSVQVAILREEGHYAQAEELARRTLRARRVLHGDPSPAVDNGLYHLAYVLYERGELDEADQLSNSALAMREATYGHIHDSIAASLVLRGHIRLARGDSAGAETAYHEAVTIWQQLDDDRPAIATAMAGQAGALAAQDRGDTGRAIAERALAMQRKRLRRGHPAIASTLATLGTIIERHAPAEAEPMFREALDIQRVDLEAGHPHTAIAQSQYGECLALEHRTAEALPLLRRSLELLREKLGDHHFETVRAARRLGEAEARLSSN